MSPSEVQITDQITGSGQVASKGALVFIHYTGTLNDGTVFDSSYTHGRPFEFVVGSKKVIQGMSQGILGMKVGGKRTIHIPADLAYGERTVGKIPAHSDLTFEVELLESRPRE
ncbi:FKBP-type peptidyl-prolyl cis-trans isomerase [Bdellovibrio sp. ZAP7]|uniref:FKBP-type peptidyl-prolyl cis-trans isomerase n=1 Tax=Bdellovibrio sp. ZAP7 TaxID=2231053 RepID=UPI00115A7289|nr:FKBP-type peptidyl-prolyl cis-trans isomerase [Bdellovibrio sp. ZAP7]QDK45882.1 FKBP-type peptidyl-prolyl cis-trans isomerase [Bdellovibrio sp. ZAP7]